MDLFKTDAKVYTVSDLNREARYLLEDAFSSIWVEGEISNFKHHSSGHRYFSLKDETSEIDAVMFKREGEKLNFEPQDGTKVLAWAKVTIYERRGNYQLVVKQMQPAGVGRLQLEFERLKQRLKEEGLFAKEHKREIPKFPTRIGLVTSPSGAAIRDIVTVISRRFPPVRLLLFPTRVQGEGASLEIESAIELANRYHLTKEPIDVLIVSRGGGSLEDLWPFNEEITARAIYDSKIPVLVGVGHEIDFTIADFTGDARAPTPSAAAETLVPDREELANKIQKIKHELINHERAMIRSKQNRLNLSLKSYGFRTVVGKIDNYCQLLDQTFDKLISRMKDGFKECEDRFNQLTKRLQMGDPQAILNRGYSIVENDAGQLVTSHRQVKEKDKIKVILKEGRLVSQVLEAAEDERAGKN